MMPKYTVIEWCAWMALLFWSVIVMNGFAFFAAV